MCIRRMLKKPESRIETIWFSFTFISICTTIFIHKEKRNHNEKSNSIKGFFKRITIYPMCRLHLMEQH